MRIGVPKEIAEGERRVALAPDIVRWLTGRGHEVVLEPGAGARAGIPDELFERAGAGLGAGAWEADVVAKVAPPLAGEVGALGADSALVGFLAPLTNGAGNLAIARTGGDGVCDGGDPAHLACAVDGRAVFPGDGGGLSRGADRGAGAGPLFPDDGGGHDPAGAGAGVGRRGRRVAGDRDVAPAGRGRDGVDVRAAVREQVQSLGARFLEVEGTADAEAAGGYARELTAAEQRAQREALAAQIARSDVVITTALVPGRPAPRLITADAANAMRPGSVIVDLAGEAGGNCELTRPGETYVTERAVTIAAPLNLPSGMAEHASQLYARNVASLPELTSGEDGALALDFEDEVIAGACITHRHVGAADRQHRDDAEPL
jgi:H+-translocating NAD(P) transhydrogenase subunit alpha